MELEHERVVEKEFGPPLGLTKRRLWGAALIVAVLGFFAMILSIFGSNGETTMFADTSGAADDPSIGMFALKASGLLVVALLVPWLASRGEKKPSEEA